jgi:hypothetical protein
MTFRAVDFGIIEAVLLAGGAGRFDVLPADFL